MGEDRAGIRVLRCKGSRGSGVPVDYFPVDPGHTVSTHSPRRRHTSAGNGRIESL